MVDSVRFTETPRHRTDLRLDLELVPWLDEHLGPGGQFGSPGHAAERALGRLRTEYEFIRSSCKKAGIPFKPERFWDLHAAEIEDSPVDPGGAGRHGQASRRGRVFASLAIDLIEWADKTCIEHGPFKTLSQAVEASLRILQQTSSFDDSRNPVSQELDALWARYKQPAKATK